MTPRVRALGVSKAFRDASAPRTVKEAVLGRRHRRPSVAALRGVDLEVAPGESLGVVGPNGAGKTTLLRIVAGVLAADAGTVERRCRVGSLLELGTGFHPDLTGRESAVLAGVIAGLPRREAKRRVDWVCEFAGLERAIDHPLGTYSSGMQARLAFAIATESQPDVLLVDEVLAVGDVAFQQRCLERLLAFKRAGSAVLLVSHQPELVRLLCDRTMWLDGGCVVDEGPTAAVVDRYVAGDRPPAAPAPGPAERRLLGVRVLDGDGAACEVAHAGAAMVVAVRLVPTGERAHLAVQVVRADGLLCVDTSTPIDPEQTDATLRIERLDLAPGDYRVAVGLYDPSWQTVLDACDEAATVRVVGTASATAALAPPATWSDRPPDGS